LRINLQSFYSSIEDVGRKGLAYRPPIRKHIASSPPPGSGNSPLRFYFRQPLAFVASGFFFAYSNEEYSYG